MKYYIYDLETYSTCFQFVGKFDGHDEVQTFEISTRKNQRAELLSWLSYLSNAEDIMMVGYNSLGFDYPIIHALLNEVHTFDANRAYHLAQQIIQGQGYGNAGNMSVSLRERKIPQCDLVKVNHFDNANRRTSLKSLQFAMRAESVEDLPYDPHSTLNDEQMDNLLKYCIHDVKETERFLQFNKHLIEMRKELLSNGVLTGDVLNYSDVKIGAEYLINKIGRTKCFHGPSKPRQTLRTIIEFNKIILPKIYFKTPPFDEVLTWFKSQNYKPLVQEDPIHLEARLAGLDFHFGIGGVHASVDSKVFHSNEDFAIKDVDVSSMYPSIAIANDFAPEHLGKDFLDAYKQLRSDRKQYPKNHSMNKTLKLALNGAFGNGDNPYSPFYDPQFPRQITINGQLQLLQLVESLSTIPQLQIIQANTDGVTAYVPRKFLSIFEDLCKEWEQETKLELEYVDYKSMWIKDVNNYLCISTKGKTKQKGAYAYPASWEEYEGYWNKDYSGLIIQKATEQMLVNNINPELTLSLATDPFDFMMRYKTPGGAKVYLGDKECSKTVRYYVSTKGQPMRKVAAPKGELGAYKRKPKVKDSDFNRIMKEIGPGVWDERIHTKNKSKYEMTETSIESGWLIKECNHVSRFDWSDVDFKYYLEQINKLKIGE